LWQKQALSDGLRVNGGRFGQDVSVGSTSASAALTKASPTASRSIAAASANTSPTASGLDAMTEIESGKATVLDLSIYSNGPGVLT